MNVPPAIDSALTRLSRRRRRVEAARVGLSGLTWSGAWLLTAALADRWTELSHPLRCAALAITAAIMAAALTRVARRLLPSRLDLLAEARLAESIDPAWRERLATVVTQADLPTTQRGSAVLNDALAGEVSAEIASRPPATFVRWTAVRREALGVGVVAVAGLVAMALPTLGLPFLLARHIRPLADLPAVTSVRIALVAHTSAVPQGQSLAVVADLINGVGPVIMHVGPDLDHLRPIVMNRTAGDRYMTTLLSLQENLVYRLTADGAAAGPVHVRVLRRPGVTGMDVTLAAADGRPPVLRPDSDGQLRVGIGTRIDLTFRVTQPLAAATVHVGATTVVAQPAADHRTWRASLIANEDAEWSISLVGGDGTHGQGPDGMRIRVSR